MYASLYSKMQLFTYYALCEIRQDFRLLLKKIKFHIITITFPRFTGRNILHALYRNKCIQKVITKQNEIAQYLFPISNSMRFYTQV